MVVGRRLDFEISPLSHWQMTSATHFPGPGLPGLIATRSRSPALSQFRFPLRLTPYLLPHRRPSSPLPSEGLVGRQH
jgi:hypothetical protein